MSKQVDMMIISSRLEKCQQGDIHFLLEPTLPLPSLPNPQTIGRRKRREGKLPLKEHKRWSSHCVCLPCKWVGYAYSVNLSFPIRQLT